MKAKYLPYKLFDSVHSQFSNGKASNLGGNNGANMTLNIANEIQKQQKLQISADAHTANEYEEIKTHLRLLYEE